MKKRFLYISCFVAFTASTGCKKYLEKEPDNRAVLNTPEKVSQLLATAYPHANYQTFAETMSDNVTDIGNGVVPDANSYNTIHDPYFYIDTRENQDDSPEFYWNACYAAIAAANQALETISKAPDKTEYAAQKGEALVARAYAHFMLVTFFSKVYDAATASSDPGIPYVKEPETVFIKQYDRKTVQYVYDEIEKDLLTGIPLIQDKEYAVPKYHFTLSAAYAFATRFYLFKKDYASVVQYGNLAVPNNNFAVNLRPWNTDYKNITDVTQLFQTYAKSTENANLLLTETQSTWARNYYITRYALDPATQQQIIPRPDKVSGGIFSYALYSVFEGTHMLIPKIAEYFVRTSVNADIGNAYVMVPLLTVEEVLFNRAEAYAYLGNTAAAIADLNTFISKRINNYSPSTNSVTADKIKTVFQTSDLQKAVISAILYYKRAEFVHEGMRWFDILRYKIPVVHTTADGQVITLGPDDPRRVLQIPQATSIVGLQQNPR